LIIDLFVNLIRRKKMGAAVGVIGGLLGSGGGGGGLLSGLLGGSGGILGGLLSGALGGIGKVLGGALQLGGLIPQMGQNNLAGGLANGLMEAFGGAVKNVINSSPMPQFIKDAANSIVDGVLGDNTQATTPEAQDAVNECCGEAMQEAGDDFGEDLQSSIMDDYMASEYKDEVEGGDGKKKEKGGGGWLAKLGRTMGGVAGYHLKKALNLSDKIGDINKNDKTMTAEEKNEQAGEMAEFQAEFQAEMQMFKMATEATSTAMKSIGEGFSSLARKQ
jgi:hypothetical protein